VDERISGAQEIEGRLTRAAELAELYQAREAIFGLPNTEYPQIELIQKTYEPYGQVTALLTHQCFCAWRMKQ
jgi:hypothetical protein